MNMIVVFILVLRFLTKLRFPPDTSTYDDPSEKDKGYDKKESLSSHNVIEFIV